MTYTVDVIVDKCIVHWMRSRSFIHSMFSLFISVDIFAPCSLSYLLAFALNSIPFELCFLKWVQQHDTSLLSSLLFIYEYIRKHLMLSYQPSDIFHA